jgi:hypothetical protein
MTNFVPALRPEIADAGKIRLGAAMKRPVAPVAVADTGKIRLGAAMKRFAR